MAIEDKNNPDLIRGKGQLSGAGNDLISGKADPNTVSTYQEKSFNHVGVTGSEPVDRLNENGTNGITTQVVEDTNTPVEKIVKDTVKLKPVGMGMPGDSGNVEKSGTGNKPGASLIGSNSVNHV